MPRRALVPAALLLSLGLLARGPALAQDAPAGGYGYAAALGSALDKAVGESVAKGRKYLLSQRDASTGAFGGPAPVGFTAIAAVAFVASTPREGVSSDPTIEKTLAFLASKQKPDGSIVSGNAEWANYETSASVSAFASARIGKYSSAQSKARDFVLSLQIQGDEKDVNFGGFPYEKEDPPYTSDLSNAQHAAQAAHDAGVTDQAFWSRLVRFLGRVQNRSETNDVVMKMKVAGAGDGEKEVVSGNDGGSGYGPGKSEAGHDARPDGKFTPRSYGSMTYALLKCLLFAGVKADDPRVVAAVGWLSKNFTVDRNPGFEKGKDQQGYYYYFLTMSRALAEYEKATGKPLVVADADGKKHEWRKELAEKLVSLQKPDGSWVNAQDRWQEGSAVLVTSYVLQALAVCQGRLP